MAGCIRRRPVGIFSRAESSMVRKPYTRREPLQCAPALETVKNVRQDDADLTVPAIGKD